jgi:ABC-type nitrate/sulfonate/bicarbonate transport system substrate-binding protein
MSKRAWIFCGALIVSIQLASASHAQDKLRVGFGSLASSHMVLLAAKDFGLFRKYNLDAEIVGNIGS